MLEKWKYFNLSEKGKNRNNEWKHGGNIKDCSLNDFCSLDKTLKFFFCLIFDSISLKGRNYARYGKTQLATLELSVEQYEINLPVKKLQHNKNSLLNIKISSSKYTNNQRLELCKIKPKDGHRRKKLTL